MDAGKHQSSSVGDGDVVGASESDDKGVLSADYSFSIDGSSDRSVGISDAEVNEDVLSLTSCEGLIGGVACVEVPLTCLLVDN